MKIFLLGFPRNGTTSFYELFLAAGFKATHDTKGALRFGEFDRDPENYIYHNKLHSSDLSKELIEKLDQEKLKEYIDQYDVFTDFPWPLLYPYLAEEYPEAYFILSERDSTKWIQSMSLFFQNRLEKSFITLYKIVFGSASPSYHKKKYCKIYLKWNDEIKKYFNGNPSLKFMSYNLEDNNSKIRSRIETFTGLKLGKFPCHNPASEQVKSTNIFKNLNFSKFNLKGCSFKDRELINVNFSHANLIKSNFQGATLTKCNFHRTYLKKASFDGAILKDCCLVKCRKANFYGSTIEHTPLQVGLKEEEPKDSEPKDSKPKDL